MANQKQPHKPLDRVVIFASDESEKFYCNVYNVDRTESGYIVAMRDDEEIVIPMSDAKPFVSNEGMIYAVNCTLELLKEYQHLGEVEKNIIVPQAFSYPGTNFEAQKSNMMWYIVVGVLGLIAILGMVT